MTAIYRPILKIAWQILWRAKYLWFFGLLAVLVSNSGELNLVINNFSSLAEQGSFLRSLKTLYTQGLLGDFWLNLKNLFANFDLSTLILLILLLVVFLFLLWIAIVSQAGLVGAAHKEYMKQPSDFGIAFKIGRQNFWKVLGLNVIGKVIIYGILLIVGIPLTLIYLKQTGDFAQLLFMLLAFVVLIPLAVIISFLIKYAVIYIVLKKQRIWQSIVSAWKLFIKNWIVSIEMAIILFIISIIAGLVMMLAAIVLTLPLSFLLYILNLLNVGGILLIGVVVALLLFIILLFWIGALLSTFQITSWVLLFDKLDGNQVFSKIARIVGGWSAKKNEKLNSE